MIKDFLSAHKNIFKMHWEPKKELLIWQFVKTIFVKNLPHFLETEIALRLFDLLMISWSCKICLSWKILSWDLNFYNWLTSLRRRYFTRLRERLLKENLVPLPCSLNCASISVKPSTTEGFQKFKAIGIWFVNHNQPEFKKVTLSIFRMHHRVWTTSQNLLR